MKKNIITYLLFALPLLMLQSCLKDDKDIFDEAAATRMQKALKEYREVITSSEYGWTMEYYPEKNQSYGGFAYAMSFTDKDVTVACELSENPEETETSLYDLISDSGPVLTFNTYNTLMHYFSTPYGSSTLYQGLKGDYEFIIMEVTPDQIILKGKKSGNKIIMRRLSEPIEDYIKAVTKISTEVGELMGILGFAGTDNGNEVYLSIDNENRQAALAYGEEVEYAPYMYTTTGIQFYKPIEIKGKTFQNLTWNSENESMTTEGGIQLIAEHDPDYPDYMQYVGKYTMTYSGVSGRKSIQIELAPKSYKQNYTIKGMLPIDLVMTYDAENKTMKLLNQQLSVKGYYLSVWNVSPGNLTYGGADFVRGMVAQLREGTTNIYDLVDYGSWEYIVRGMILWGASGEYKGFSESRFYDITLTKNE